MSYDTDKQSVNLIDGENSVATVKSALISLLDLDGAEKERIESISTSKDLLSFVNKPGDYLGEVNAKRFLELKELLDLLGGIYYA